MPLLISRNLALLRSGKDFLSEQLFSHVGLS